MRKLRVILASVAIAIGAGMLAEASLEDIISGALLTLGCALVSLEILDYLSED